MRASLVLVKEDRIVFMPEPRHFVKHSSGRQKGVWGKGYLEREGRPALASALAGRRCIVRSIHRPRVTPTGAGSKPVQDTGNRSDVS